MITFQYNNGLSYDQWRFLRKDSIGSSSVGAICFGSAYKCSLEIFYEKITGITPSVDNIRTFLGKKTEPLSDEMWSYYDGTAQSIVKNYNAGTPVKKGENRNVTIFNSKYPGRSSTPDITILPFGVYSSKSGEGYCEIKNTQSYILKSYNDQLPPENVFQLCDQMIIGEKHYGELFYFIDNLSFSGYPLERKSMKNIEDTIIRETGDLWNRIVLAKPLYNQMYEAKRNNNNRLAAELDAEIQRLEPAPQNSAGYLNYLTQRYKDRVSDVGLIKGDDVILKIAKKHKELGKKMDILKKEKQMMEIELRLFLKANNAIDFGKLGKVTNYETSSGNRLLKNNIK